MFLLRRHMSFYLAAFCGLAALSAGLFLDTRLAMIIAANCFFLVYLALTLRLLPILTHQYLKKHAAVTDEPTWIIFLVTFATVLTAVISLFLLINQHPKPDVTMLVLSLASVPLGWASIHMMAAIHYAHMYWQPDDDTEGKSDKADNNVDRIGGFDFPHTQNPSGWDFVYFAYVIGMTAQTSDVSVTTTYMRKITLLHSIITYFFNTVLVAAAVNVAVALGS